METNSNSTSDLIVNVIIYLGLFILVWLFIDFFTGKKSSTSTFDLNVHRRNGKGKKQLNETISARDKACVAVGLCHPDENEVLSVEQLYRWKIKILDNAEKIFGKNKLKAKINSSKRKK